VLSAFRRPRDKYWLARFGDAGRGRVKKKVRTIAEPCYGYVT
jgi:hypothetical protein